MFKIPVYMSYIGNVIGGRGFKFKIKLENQTRVRVNVGSRDSAVNGMIKVTLKGDKQGCDEAKNIILELISEQTEVFEIYEHRKNQREEPIQKYQRRSSDYV